MRLVAAVLTPRPPPGPAHVAVRHADTRAARAAADPHLAPPRGARGRGLVTAARAVRPPVTHLPGYRDQNSRRTCFVKFLSKQTENYFKKHNNHRLLHVATDLRGRHARDAARVVAGEPAGSVAAREARDTRGEQQQCGEHVYRHGDTW